MTTPGPHVDFAVVDADNHYYESPDAFTRHIPKDMAKRCMQWADINGKRRLLVGGEINRFIPNPTWDPIARPGSLDDYFRGNNTDGRDIISMFGELDALADHPEYQDRDKRLEVMDQQGMEAAYFFPTLAVGMQQSLRDDPEAASAAFTALNRWLEDDWGYAYKERIFAAPVISLIDPDAAVAEVDRVLANGARMVCMVPGPVPTPGGGSQSPAMADYDPVWARINEAGIAVGIHGGDGGMGQYLSTWEPTDAFQSFKASPFQLAVTHNRQIADTVLALICHGLFDRFPRLRIASIENGGAFVHGLAEDLQNVYGKMPQEFQRDPVETLQQHFWISPYYEDDIDGIKDILGADHVLFGSDYPHAEGLAEPTAFVHDIPNFTAEEVKLVMRENALSLLQPI